MESAEPLLPEEVSPSDDAWRPEEEFDEEESPELSELSEEDEDDDESVSPLEPEPVPVLEPELELDEPVLPDAVVSASAAACIEPTRANTPAAAASVTAAAAAAVRRAPLRTAAAAPRSLPVMAAPLPSDALSRPTVGEQPERSL
ncbi:hypothetical protein [Streptomyces sp. NBC_00203]|uniref:hypothetical protein n=1 Tax=Streptomyces sp. NBC_00203 TaxID=2975680 RepID=UPI00325348DD